MTARLATAANKSPWIRRLVLPAYQVKDAARYAGISSQTILNWQRSAETNLATISDRENGKHLSYLQLIEIAVVSAMRKAGVSLAAIRYAREFMSQRLSCEFPFAQYRFKTDGKNVITELSNFDRGQSKDKLIVLNKGGQLAWRPILEERLQQFEYYKDGFASRWHVLGQNSSIIIDPQISFGAPAIKGIPTWTIKGRLLAGESVDEIAEDFSLKSSDVRIALEFEGVKTNNTGNKPEWTH